MNRNFIRLAAANIETNILNIDKNYKQIKKCIEFSKEKNIDLLVFPELTFTGVSAGQMIASNEILSTSNRYLKDLLKYTKDIDTLIDGCTHFSLLENPIKKVLGNINYISSGLPMGIELSRYLTENNMLTIKNKNGVIKIYTTGDKGQAIKTMQWFKTEHNPVEKINI